MIASPAGLINHVPAEESTSKRSGTIGRIEGSAPGPVPRSPPGLPRSRAGLSLFSRLLSLLRARERRQDDYFSGGRNRTGAKARPMGRPTFGRHTDLTLTSHPTNLMNYYGSNEIAESWRTVRKNTVRVAEDIPADKYDFRAADGTMTVGEMLAHIAVAPYWAQQCHFVECLDAVTGDDFGRWMGEIGKAAAALTTKAEIIDALTTDGEAFASQIESMTAAELAQDVALPFGSKTRFEMLLGSKEHEMHHRAQLFLMERMIGIVPHLTRERQARSAASS